MRRIVKIGDLELEVNNYQELFKESSFSGKSLLKAILNCQIQGVSNNKHFLDIVKSEEISFKADINDKNPRKVRVRSKSWSYSGSIQTESTLYNHEIELEEIDPDEPEKWNLLAAQFETVITNRMIIRTLIEFLQEKGMFSKEQFEEKLKEIENRDYEEFREFLTRGPKDFGKK